MSYVQANFYYYHYRNFI